MISKRLFLGGGLAMCAAPSLSSVLPGFAREAERRRLRAIVVIRGDETIAARGYNGFGLDDRVNIKSASKSVVSALVGAAIDRGVLDSVDQPIAPILEWDLPRNPDPRLYRITIGHLLSMQAGLESMSGPNYGRWVSSRNWVQSALAAPFVAEPGTRMQYSTASTHLLSAVLTRVSGQSTLSLARDWFSAVDGFKILSWDRDPQGIYFGGNQMAMSTRSLAAFGALYLRRGRAPDGTEVLPPAWIYASWAPRTVSRWSGDGYGYGWFLRRIGGETAFYGWGYGGQMIYILPKREMVIAITSDPTQPSARTGYRDWLHWLAGEISGAV